MSKPKHKLPDILTSSHLVGITIMELKNLNDQEKLGEFISRIQKLDHEMSFEQVYEIATEYVEFYS